jgi:sialidase-1
LKVKWTKNGPFEKTTVFKSGTGGFACYRIPALVRTSRGTLIAFCEGRKRNCGDWAHGAIVARRCIDPINYLGNWEAPFVVHESDRLVEPVSWAEIMAAAAFAEEKGLDEEDPGFKPKIDVCTNNPAPIVDRDGKTIHLVYCEHYDSAFYTRSTDDGLTWSAPRDLDPVVSKFKEDYDWTVIAAGPGHGVQLLRGPHAGRLVVPFWLASNRNDPRSHRPSQVAGIYSDDGGKTWERGGFVPFTESNPSESQAIQLEDGRVLINSRHDTAPGTAEPMRRFLTTSLDGAHGWSRFQFDATLPEPVCLGSLIKLAPLAPGGKSITIFSGPDGNASLRSRQNLTAWLSYDDCKTWLVKRAIEPGGAAYSDLAVDARNGWIYCLYEDASIPGALPLYNGLTIARFNVEWLEGGHGKAL